jgi:uncharacterized protein (DUF1919 family)
MLILLIKNKILTEELVKRVKKLYFNLKVILTTMNKAKQTYLSLCCCAKKGII